MEEGVKIAPNHAMGVTSLHPTPSSSSYVWSLPTLHLNPEYKIMYLEEGQKSAASSP